jgi:hypothetical protein
MAHAGGRPLKFKSVKELQQKIDAYFAMCDPHVEQVKEWVEARDKSGKLLKDDNGLNYLIEIEHMVMTKQIPYGITGLALALDTSRETLLDYEKGKYDSGEDIEGYKAEFSDTIKAAKVKIENYNELMLYSPSPTGTIFNLKNNFGWKDKTEQELSNPDGSLSSPYARLTEEQLNKLAG